MKAQWNNTIIADSERTIIMEGIHYFPQESLKKEYFKESKTESTCPWKGCASYYDLLVDNQTLENAAWYYKEPNSLIANLDHHVAFVEGIEIISE